MLKHTIMKNYCTEYFNRISSLTTKTCIIIFCDTRQLIFFLLNFYYKIEDILILSHFKKLVLSENRNFDL